MQRNTILTVKAKGACISAFRVLLLATLVIYGCTAFAIAGQLGGRHGNDDDRWIGTWGTALHEPDLGIPGLSNAGFNNQTLRQIVHISVGGHRVRVRFSAFGANAVVIGDAHIALQAGGPNIIPASDRRLTFEGRPSRVNGRTTRRSVPL
jgi:hypothetical protein